MNNSLVGASVTVRHRFFSDFLLVSHEIYILGSNMLPQTQNLQSCYNKSKHKKSMWKWKKKIITLIYIEPNYPENN